MSEPKPKPKPKKRRRSARVYVNVGQLTPQEIAERLAVVASFFPPDEDGTPAVSVAAKRHVSQAERKRLAREGKALPNGSYPIESAEDLDNAAVLARTGHGDVEAARRLIARRAKELGVNNPLESAAKSTMGNVPPGHGRSLTEARVSEPLTAGRAATARDDHGVGQGRNTGIAWAHQDLGQSNPNSFNALANLQTVNAEGNGDRGITWHAGEAALRMFDARGAAGRYVGMNPVNPSPARPDWHIAQGSAVPPNGSHSTAVPSRPPTGAMKGSEALALMKRHLFPGSGGGR